MHLGIPAGSRHFQGMLITGDEIACPPDAIFIIEATGLLSSPNAFGSGCRRALRQFSIPGTALIFYVLARWKQAMSGKVQGISKVILPDVDT